VLSNLKARAPSFLVKEDDIRNEIVGLNTEIVHASADFEVAFFSPAWAVGVTDDPVLHLEFLVVAVADDEDSVVNRKPLQLVGVGPVVVGHLVVLLILKYLGFQDSGHGSEADVIFLSQNT